jgi:hypothetical protein
VVLAGSTSKKIIAVRFQGEAVQGFVNPPTYLQETGMELITSSGAVVTIPYEDVKAVCFVKDFETVPVWKENRAFSNRPKLEGLWIRLHFRDGDTLEGIIANDLLLMEEHGLSVAPPDAGFQNRVFIPRQAVSRIQVLGVVGSPLRRRAAPKPSAKEQLKMFE